MHGLQSGEISSIYVPLRTAEILSFCNRIEKACSLASRRIVLSKRERVKGRIRKKHESQEHVEEVRLGDKCVRNVRIFNHIFNGFQV